MKTARTTLASAIALATVVSAGLLALAAAQAETRTERQQRIALALEAENPLAKLHDARVDAKREPCINAAVSPRGRFAGAEIERVVERLAAGDLTEYLDEGAYCQAFNAGRITPTDCRRVSGGWKSPKERPRPATGPVVHLMAPLRSMPRDLLSVSGWLMTRA